MSPVAPVRRARERPGLEGNGPWIEKVLDEDLSAPRKQRHTAKRIYDRLVEERGFTGSYSTVRRFVAEFRRERSSGAGEGFLELEWAPGACQVDYGNFRAAIAGETVELKLLVATLPHSNDRQCVATMSQRSECMCAGLVEIFRRWGRAPRVIVLDNATEAGRMLRGTVTESRLFSQMKGHYRFESRYCNPYSGNEKGSVENAVGFLRRNLLVPVPSFGGLAELNAFLERGCAALSGKSCARDGRPTAEALAEDLAAMRALPGVDFDPVRWVRAHADKRGYVTVDGREYVAGPAWHGRDLLVGMRADTVEILADRGRRVAVLERAYGEGPAVRNPLSLVPALVARPRAFGESTVLPHDCGARGVVEARDAQAGRVPGGIPGGGKGQQGGVQTGLPAEALRPAGAEDVRGIRLVGRDVARGARQGLPALARIPRCPRGPGPDGRCRDREDPHGLGALRARMRAEDRGEVLHGVLARREAEARTGGGAAGQGGRADRQGGASRHRRTRIPAARCRGREADVPGLRRRLRAPVGADHDEPGVQPVGLGVRR